MPYAVTSDGEIDLHAVAVKSLGEADLGVLDSAASAALASGQAARVSNRHLHYLLLPDLMDNQVIPLEERHCLTRACIEDTEGHQYVRGATLRELLDVHYLIRANEAHQRS